MSAPKLQFKIKMFSELRLQSANIHSCINRFWIHSMTQTALSGSVNINSQFWWMLSQLHNCEVIFSVSHLVVSCCTHRIPQLEALDASCGFWPARTAPASQSADTDWVSAAKCALLCSAVWCSSCSAVEPTACSFSSAADALIGHWWWSFCELSSLSRTLLGPGAPLHALRWWTPETVVAERRYLSMWLWKQNQAVFQRF